MKRVFQVLSFFSVIFLIACDGDSNKQSLNAINSSCGTLNELVCGENMILVCIGEEGNLTYQKQTECSEGETCEVIGTVPTCTDGVSVCGDGDMEGGEECDDGNLEDGDGCSSTCKKEAAAVCGDNKVNGDEVCDGETVDCSTVGHYMPGYMATCMPDCKRFNLGECIERDENDTCGNGTKDGDEVCEISDTKDCSELGVFESGTMAPCNYYCSGYDTANCVANGTDTCKIVYECVANCQDAACQQECRTTSNPTELGKYDAMQECFQTQCGTLTDQNEFSQCAQEKCANEISACGLGQ